MFVGCDISNKTALTLAGENNTVTSCHVSAGGTQDKITVTGIRTPGVVWTFGQKQDRIVEELREAAEPLSARVLADRAECSKEHVRQTMRRFEDEDGDHDVQVFESVGEHGATLYAATGLPNSGVVDVGSPTEAYGSIYTWGLAIRDPNPIETDDDQPDGPASAETRTFWEPLGGVDPGGTGG
ncbi:hypothetical protein [Haloplanus litoreus]|uniref:hypothetical protein n=1 Tax=Haloplanus sp. GX21 TaxID=3127120 RepID=UPI00388E40E1